MRKIVVFGATGGTGKEVIRQALQLGYQVTAVVRNPAGYPDEHPRLHIVKGDVLHLATFEQYIVGNDAVISCLGTSANLSPTTIYSDGIQNIISAMGKAGVKRLICISSGALYTNKNMGVFIRLLAKVVLQKILKNIYADMRVMEATIENSNLDWTVVRPPMLKDKPLTGRYRTALHSHIKRPFSIARADLAHYMLSAIDDAKTFKAKAEIAY